MIAAYIKKIYRHVILGVIKAVLNLARAHVLATLGLIGLLFALWFSFSKGQLPDIPSNQISMPASSPFAHTISGVGFVEASSKNISVGSSASGIVQKVHVKEGDIVEAKAPLFELDTREALLQIAVDEQEVRALEYSVDAAKATFGYAEDLYNRDKKLKEGVKSRSDIKKVEFEYQKASADLKAQQTKLEQARTKCALSMIVLDKLIVKAPVAGMILKTNLVEGEYISNISPTSIITMGSEWPLYVRVQIDENDIWRYEKGSRAVGFLRSNSTRSYPLTLVRFEPYAVPKNQLSGNNSELVDTRIVEIIYKIENDAVNPDLSKNQPQKGKTADASTDASAVVPSLIQARTNTILIGQQMDIFIETSQAG